MHRPISTILAMILVATAMLSCGKSSQPPPKLGVRNWKPPCLGGTLEVRPLPPADEVAADWDKWLDSETAVKGRVYETVLSSPTNQKDFQVEVKKSNTPLGWSYHTYATFLYSDPTNGTYEFMWYRLGRHNADFLKLQDAPKKVWVRLNSVANRKGVPLLDVEAFEGLEPTAGIIAESGRKKQ